MWKIPNLRARGETNPARRTSSVKCLCQINMQILFALVTPWEIRGQLKVPSAYLKSRKVNAYHFVPSTWPTASLSSTLNTAMPLSVALLRSDPVWFSCSALDFTLYLLGFVPHTLERSPAFLHSQQAAHFFRCLWSTLPCYNYSSSSDVHLSISFS